MSNIKKLLIVMVLIICALPAFALEDNLTIVGDDAAATQAFMEVYFRDMASPDQDVTIYIGQLPPEMPVDLPETEDAVIGAITRVGPYSNTELIYQSSRSVDAIEQFYQAELTQRGWERIGPGYQPRGFVAQEQSYVDFCNAELGMSINLNIRDIEGETILRLNLNQADPYMCNQGNMDEAYQNDPYLRLPELSAPDGVTIQVNRGGGGGGGGYPGGMYAATSTWLTSTELDLNGLMAAYEQQLVDNGWEQLSSEVGEHISLSMWTFTNGDTQWSGYFSLMGHATESNDYYATIMVEQVQQ